MEESELFSKLKKFKLEFTSQSNGSLFSPNNKSTPEKSNPRTLCAINASSSCSLFKLIKVSFTLSTPIYNYNIQIVEFIKGLGFSHNFANGRSTFAVLAKT